MKKIVKRVVKVKRKLVKKKIDKAKVREEISSEKRKKLAPEGESEAAMSKVIGSEIESWISGLGDSGRALLQTQRAIALGMQKGSIGGIAEEEEEEEEEELEAATPVTYDAPAKKNTKTKPKPKPKPKAATMVKSKPSAPTPRPTMPPPPEKGRKGIRGKKMKGFQGGLFAPCDDDDE
eukprot:TRINITY_DN3435_c1_g2_i1.p1 TRINITY_DN3435_c1_g2~~TRINITY_DN3435_c1_g2_i1.p1  ORF type:complete len:178 (+),score=46.93 TRINITY_DN3435_c1_g2_i1:63-596(+)